MASGFTGPQARWLIVACVLSVLLFVGVFVPSGPAATPDQLAMLNSGDTAWVLCATALVLFMTPGLAFFYGGMVRHHSVISTMLQCSICLGLIGMLWVMVGFSLVFGDDAGGFIGNPWTYLYFRNVGTAPNPAFAPTIPFQLFAMFQLKFAVITPALTAGGYIERIRFAPFLIFIVLYLFIVYCPVAHWVWHPQGFIRLWGVKDFAGGTVVHMTSGYAALAGAMMVGPRVAKVRGEEMRPNNIPFVMLGTGMLWFGWFGFNGGSELAADQVATRAVVNTNTATAAAMVMWTALEGATGHKPSAVGACVGAVVGLVVITPACGYVTVGQSLLMGGLAAALCTAAVRLMHHSKIDDGLDAWATHGVGGTLGCILTGAFDPEGPLVGNWSAFGYYWAAIVIVAVWSFLWTCLLFFAIGRVTRIRLTASEEDFGLDETQHNESVGASGGSPLAESTLRYTVSSEGCGPGGGDLSPSSKTTRKKIGAEPEEPTSPTPLRPGRSDRASPVESEQDPSV
jgi:Amt family ammonium transporter